MRGRGLKRSCQFVCEGERERKTNGQKNGGKCLGLTVDPVFLLCITKILLLLLLSSFEGWRRNSLACVFLGYVDVYKFKKIII